MDIRHLTYFIEVAINLQKFYQSFQIPSLVTVYTK